jgi:hypothetical protein
VDCISNPTKLSALNIKKVKNLPSRGFVSKSIPTSKLITMTKEYDKS